MTIHPYFESREELNTALHRLRQTVDQYDHEAQRGYDIAYSVGAVQFDAARHTDVTELMAEADALMYGQKNQTRTRDGAGQAPTTTHEQAAV